MESFFSRFRNALVLTAVLLAQMIALAVQVHRPIDAQAPDSPEVRLVRLIGLALVSPIERVTSGTSHGLRAAWANYVDLRRVRQQDQEFRRQIAQLRLERAALSEDALEGQRLRTLLNFQQSYVTSTVVAQVIGTSGSDQSRLLTLDKGWHDGLKPDMAVITPDGIVGKLRDVFPGTSQLLLINDPTSGAGVILQSTRTRAVLRGSTSGRLQILDLTADARIKPGEIVLTSGGDQVFPRGLPVGVIESITPDLDHQPYTLITLQSAAKLDQLEEVLIITAMSASLNLEVSGASGAQATAARAGQLGAGRLPGMHEDTAAVDPAAVPGAPGTSSPGTSSPGTSSDAAAPPPENAPGLVPKPKPVLHPDRYSPGSAPDAADMTPGAPRQREP